MRSVGTYISGAGHAGLVVWMVVGWGMASEPLPFEVTEVSMVSGEEFAALTQGVQPDLPAGSIEAPEPPVIETPEPPAPVVETPPEVAPPPEPIETPTPETPPEAPDLTVPETVVTDTPPDVPDTPTIVAPPPSAELGSSPRPVPRPAPRVAPEIVAPPEPDATVAPEVAEAATEETDAPVEEEVEVADETTAPEAAADQIVTEAEEPSFAPEISSRPSSRPARPTPAPAEEPTTETASETSGETSTETEIDPVAAALAEAAAANPTPTPGLGGGDISDRDKANILRQIGGCWNLGAVSSSAIRTSVTVRFSMDAGGVLDTGSFEMTSFSGGSAADAEIVYRAARSALTRCPQGNSRNYDVPEEQFQTRRDLQLVFDPSQMALR